MLNSCGPEEASRLRFTPGGYVLELERHELDLTLFEDLTNNGREVLDAGEVTLAREYLERAVGLWRGRICQGASIGPKLETELLYWEELHLASRRLLLQARLRLGEYHQAIAEIRMLLVSNPLCEDLWGMLMLAFYRSYRRADALKVFSVARRRFIQELGMEPTSDLQNLHHSILRGDCPLDGFSWLSRSAA
ncbi:AfsR/SARP family transcriptional regulator [Micromonospora sp. LOL_024]|uniref:AfsR/SARP family transcriptional regulator n=1 Tax=Micromonospora sp. LOL_024 TaxID=3345412 RepID=UPI003A8C8805